MYIADDPNEFYKLDEVRKEALLKYCNSLIKIKSFNTRHTSYGLKHKFETLYRNELYEKGSYSYVSNGQFKGAMLEVGFKVKDKKAKNWIFNVSQRSVDNR